LILNIYFDHNKENKVMVPDGDGIRLEKTIKIIKKKIITFIKKN
jgi:hypothetical protein